MTSLRFAGPVHASGKYDKFEMKRHYYCLSDERKKERRIVSFLAPFYGHEREIQHRFLFTSILTIGCWFHIVLITSGYTCIFFLKKIRHEELLYIQDILSDVYNVTYGVCMYKGVGVRSADFISSFLNIPLK